MKRFWVLMLAGLLVYPAVVKAGAGPDDYAASMSQPVKAKKSRKAKKAKKKKAKKKAHKKKSLKVRLKRHRGLRQPPPLRAPAFQDSTSSAEPLHTDFEEKP